MAKCRGWRCSLYENTVRAYVINSEGAAELIVQNKCSQVVISLLVCLAMQSIVKPREFAGTVYLQEKDLQCNDTSNIKHEQTWMNLAFVGRVSCPLSHWLL